MDRPDAVYYSCNCSSRTMVYLLVGAIALYIALFSQHGTQPNYGAFSGGSGGFSSGGSLGGSSLADLLLGSPRQAYLDSVAECVELVPSKIHRNLVAISHHTPQLLWRNISGHEHVLAVTWTSWQGWREAVPSSSMPPQQALPSLTLKYEVWVTAVPELALRCSEYRAASDAIVVRRLEQLLGLPPGYNKQMAVEVWVQPKDLFRPCHDPEITDHACEITYRNPVGSGAQLRAHSVSALHREWINHRVATVYTMPPVTEECNATCALKSVYPWTRMGYTYDWGTCPKALARLRANGDIGPHDFAADECYGASEFVIIPGSKVYIERIVPTLEYCRDLHHIRS